MSVHGKCTPTQEIYRQLLNAMSHPGRAYHLPLEDYWPNGWLAISETLLDHEVAFSVVGEKEPRTIADKIRAATKARPADPSEADYVIVLGSSSGGAVCRSKRGTLEYPDRSASLIYILNDSESLFLDNVRLTGPGIPDFISPQIGGIDRDELICIRSANEAYPLGVDCIFLNKANHVMCIPRSTRIKIG